jgi:arylsulfatase A-like enzyme
MVVQMVKGTIMDRRDFLKTVGVGATGLMFSSLLGAAPVKRKPNVIVVFIDDLGYGDLACYGNKHNPTPNIDKLAAEGVRFTNNYVTNPPCSPSRASMLTGQYAQRFGKFGMCRGQSLPTSHPLLSELMRDAGYVTGQIGKWDVGDKNQGPHQRGFMEVAKWAELDFKGKYSYLYTCNRPNGEVAYRTEVDGDYMVEFIERNKEKPFFLYFSPVAVHDPLEETPKKYIDRVKTGDNKWYAGALLSLDDQIGRMMDVLKKHKLDENTIIMFNSDNGPNIKGGSPEPFRGYKTEMWEDGFVRTPAIVRWPGTIPAGQTFDGLACTFDMYSTAAAIAETKLPKVCDGENLMPYMTGKKDGDVHEYVYWYNVLPNRSTNPYLAVVRWKNWRAVEDRSDYWTTLEDLSPRKWKLFDMEKDPQELNDISAEHPKVVKHLKRKHEKFVAELPSLDSMPPYDNSVFSPPLGWGWVIGDGK